MIATLMPKDQTDLASPKKAKTVRELGAVDISGVREDILNLPQSLWQSEDTGKPNKFEQLGKTEHIVFRFVKDYDKHWETIAYPIWDEWKDRLQPLMDQATKAYGYQKGDFSRVMLAKLPPHSKISLQIGRAHV